ncbi:uncharacterized protein LOC130673443 [Microplitis mediator]|uniref:uncharacterized protein LOC130673443 n=1 Tax=Microplitis mediator TaxID=375433 RepID=UPI00255694F4|nr:uncharacterized protein LOC130673443 [Microplitis mediator]
MFGNYTEFNNSNKDETYFMLRDAVQRKNSELAKSLLNNGAQVNSPYERSCNTILHYATMNRNEELVQMLLDRGAYIDVPNTQGKTPLHLAVECGSEPIVKLLVNKGANVNTIAKDNSTPIEKAISTWQCHIFSLLVRHGANVNITLSNGQTLLYEAVQRGYTSVVKCILEKSSVNKNKNKNCLTTAVLKGNEEIEHHLLEHGFEVEPQCVNNSKFFHAIVARGYIKCVTDLLKMGADVNALRQETTKYTLLHTACINQKLEMARLLIQHDINLNVKDNKEKTAIFYAVKNGDFNIVKLLITNGACVEDDPDLLNIAAHNQCIDIVQILLEHGVDINAYDCFGKTALHSALIEQFFQLEDKVICILSSKDVKASLVRVLLNKGADVNIRMKDGQTALHLAVRTDNKEIVDTVLECNSKVNVSDAKGTTPIHLAVQTKNVIIVFSLLSKNADIKAMDIKGMTALHFAAEVGHLDIIKILLRYEPDVNAINQFCLTPLHCAAKYGHLEAVKILLEHNANVNAVDIRGSTALHLAVEAKHRKIAKYLLKFNRHINSPNDNGETYLHIAVKNDDIDTTRLLLNYSIDVNCINKNGLTPLLIAALGNFSILTELLIENGADIHVTDPRGRSVLHIAAKNNNLESVSILLEKHADVNCKDKNGLTPLLIAVRLNHEDLTDLSLEHNADVNCPEQNNEPAIDIAMEKRNETIVLKLLTHGADVNFVDDEGSTVLLNAIWQAPSPQFIEKLLMFGADVNHRNNKGETALHIASRVKRRDIIEILLRYGADINIKCQRNKIALLHLYEYTNSENRPSSSGWEGCENFDCEGWDGGRCTSWQRKYRYDEDDDYQHFSCHVDECSSIVAVFKRHILKLQVAKFDVDNSNIHALKYFETMKSDRDNGENYDIDFDEYNESDSDIDIDSGSKADNENYGSKEIMELESMKNERMGNSNISFYDFLTSSVHRLAKYVKNKNIVEMINLNDYELIFPIYSDIIKSRYHIGMERNKLLAQCEFLGDIFVDLPDTCIDEIISYLNNQELRFLTNAYKDRNFSNKRKIHLKNKVPTPNIIMSGYHKKFDNCNNDGPDAQLRIAVQRRDHSGAYLNKQNTCGETALHLATIDRDVEMVKVLLDKCIYSDYLDIKDNNGKTALHLAAECGSEPIVKLLVNKGANVNTIARDHSRPIEKVISTWRNNIFKLLVCHGAYVDITLSDGESLLLRAIKSCEPSTVKCILEKSSIDKNINKTCLTTAVLQGNEEIEQHLIKHGFEVEPQCVNNSKFFHAIVARGYTKFVTDLLAMEMARLLIQHDINLNVKDHKEKTAIFYAVKNGDFNIVKLLITNGACVEDDPDLLNIAALNQCSDTVQILLEHGVDINACDSFGKTALHSAFVKQSSQLNNDVIYKIEPSLIRVLLNKGADVNMPMNDGRTALHLAVQTDNEEIVNTLLEYNPKVNVSDAKGITPLHLAAQTENSKIVDSLLNKNADITAVDIKGMTALHFAAEVGHLDIIKNLLKYEPNVYAIDEFNSTLLHGAAKYGYLDTINCVNGEGSTALLIAISHSLSLEFIKELLTFGADVNYRNTKGETALHIASKMKQREIIEILLRYGADINIKCQRNKTALLHTYEYKRPKFFSSRVIDCDCEEYGCGCADDCYSWELRDQYDEEEFRFDHFSCHVKDCCPIVEVFKHHILKLKAVKFYVDKNNILGLEYFEELKSNIYFDVFDQSDSDRDSFSGSPVVDNNKVNMELESMKNERIGNSNTTFYNFLTSNIHQLARYVKNKNIVDVINSNDYQLIFPIFSDIIESRFHIGIERHKLLARCDFLCDIFVDLPDICIDEILSYLNNQELRFLTNAYKNQYVLNKRKIFLNL